MASLLQIYALKQPRGGFQCCVQDAEGTTQADMLLFELTPCHCHVILIDRVAYVTLWVAMAQMQLVTQPIAHSYRRTELWLYNYVRHAPSM